MRELLVPAAGRDRDPGGAAPARLQARDDLERVERAVGLWAESLFEPLFDAVLFSADERMMKPDRRLYERMAELLGVSTADCVFVGDGAYRELQGAEAAGMTAVLIRAPYDEWEHEGTIGWDGPRVSSLSEVLALV